MSPMCGCSSIHFQKIFFLRSIETRAQEHRQQRKHDRTVARCTELLALPPTTFQLCIIVLDLWTFFIMPDDPRPLEPLIRRDQNAMVQCVLFPMPIANHAGIERHFTLMP